MDPRSQRLVLVLLLFVLTLGLYRDFGDHVRVARLTQQAASFAVQKPLDEESQPQSLEDVALKPANSTLGFGSILAVSRPQSPRRSGLLLAANITSLDITIPPQPQWTESDITHLRTNPNTSTLTRGSALAWLGHLHALRTFLASNATTTLVIEDDIDWDIHLRTTQIPLAASAFRSLLSNFSPPPPTPQTYWAPPTAWDILWLGTCNDAFTATTYPHPSLSYTDATLPPPTHLSPETATLLASLNVPPQTRLLHPTVSPLCTFGYALTRAAAERLLHDIATREAPLGTAAYDVRVLEACRDLGMRCWSVAPELMRHLGGGSEIADVDSGRGGGREEEEGGRREGTANLACGVRSSRGFREVGEGGLEEARRAVGEGRCLGEGERRE
ncbi:hypothetical protein WHR41_05185 [Cladosporium halotolerans]|uniref:Glycosyltransferase family 25 protein n=1 Tax=Cladosporium halotolerans TaxID=1052096 RepID=A0AB34KN70_9PEZI